MASSLQGPAPGRMRYRPLHAALIAALAFALYANTLRSPFVFDDLVYIVDNPYVQDLSYLLHPSQIPSDGEYSVARVMRPRYVGYLSFALNYRMGGLDPIGYRAVNIALHAACALLLYALVLAAFRTPALRGSVLAARPDPAALAAALAFAAHPLATEAVSYVSQRFTSLAALFYLGSVLLHLEWRCLTSGRGERHGAARTIALQAGSLLFALLAMKTKENAFTIPFAAALAEWAFFPGAPRGMRVRALLPMALLLPAVPLGVMEFSGGMGDALLEATRTQRDITRTQYLLTQLPVVAHYIKLLFLPVGQTLDYDFPLEGRMTAQALGTAGFLAALAVGVLCLALRPPARADAALRLVGFGGAWFFLTLSVESSFIALADVIFEHRTYLPMSMALAGFSAAGGLLVRGRPGACRAAAAMTAVLLALLCIATVARNGVWQSPVALWSDVSSKAPAKPRGLYNLGLANQREGHAERALELYQEALAADPGYVKALYNIALLYEDLGLIDKAVQAYRRTIDTDPMHYQALNNLGALYIGLGRKAEALDALHRSLRIAPESPQAHVNLGILYFSLGRKQEALRRFRLALSLDPDNPEALYNLARANDTLK